MKLGRRVKIDTDATIETPLKDFHIFNISFFVWKKSSFHFDILETYPYAEDGDVPAVFVRFSHFEILFYSKLIYKFIYKKRHGVKLDI